MVAPGATGCAAKLERIGVQPTRGYLPGFAGFESVATPTAGAVAPRPVTGSPEGDFGAFSTFAGFGAFSTFAGFGVFSTFAGSADVPFPASEEGELADPAEGLTASSGLTEPDDGTSLKSASDSVREGVADAGPGCADGWCAS